MTKPHIQLSLDRAEWLTKNLPIRLFGDPILINKCESVSSQEFKNGSAKKWADELTDFLRKYRAKTGAGRGLAANQIGISKRMVLVWSDEEPKVYVNPEVTESIGKGVYPESCISSASLIMGDVERAWNITVNYMTIEGKRKLLKADAITTRIILHEIDHLDGSICSDKYIEGTIRLTSGDRSEILKQELIRIN